MTGQYRIHAGRYKGELLDDESRRSVLIRDEVADLPRGRLVVDYFYHAGKYWTAVIPLHGVDQIFGQAFNFSKPKTRYTADGPENIYDSLGVPKRRLPMLNHVQSRFRLQPDYSVDLYELHSNPTGEPIERVRDFVYSLEAVGPLGVGFGFRDALWGNLISAHRFVSTDEIVFERIVVEGQYVTESPPIPLTDEQKAELLLGSLQRSHRAGMSERYYLYRCCGSNNCTSNPLQLLDKSVDYSLRQRLGSILFRLPLNPRLYLRVRGMDADPKVRKLLRHEFAEYINAPETQQRKRTHVRSKVKALRAARDQRKRRA
jgi:hypothetical protein